MYVIVLARWFACTVVLCVVCTTTLQAGACGYSHCWGAVAVAPDGAAARSSGLRTAHQAWKRANRACGGKCKVIEPFSDGCGAIVTDRDQAAWPGFAGTRDGAIAEATASCAWSPGRGCRVRIWACSR
ncbi:MAG: DUF4189 domain-containing protein [Rhodobacter sp.]|nr:DUF4189 domain-containing protein [Rhodobacter sp.]